MRKLTPEEFDNLSIGDYGFYYGGIPRDEQEFSEVHIKISKTDFYCISIDRDREYKDSNYVIEIIKQNLWVDVNLDPTIINQRVNKVYEKFNVTNKYKKLGLTITCKLR